MSPRRSLAASLQISLCCCITFHPSLLSQLPKVTSQILPSALTGDTICSKDGLPRALQPTGLSSPEKRKGFCGPHCSCAKSHVAFALRFLLQGKGDGLLLCPHSIYVIGLFFSFTVEGLARVWDSLIGGLVVHRMPELGGAGAGRGLTVCCGGGKMRGGVPLPTSQTESESEQGPELRAPPLGR